MARKQQTNNVDRKLVGAQNAVQIEHGDVRQRDKVKKKNNNWLAQIWPTWRSAAPPWFL
jgi:hypothetical protein